MFTPLDLNNTHNTRAVTNHLLDILQRQTTHYGTYSIASVASSAWNGLQRNTIENLLECKISEFKKIIFEAYLAKHFNKSATNLLRHYLTKSLYTINSVRFFYFFIFLFSSFLFYSFVSLSLPILLSLSFLHHFFSCFQFWQRYLS